MAILVPNLATLRAEVNARWPARDKASDGWIGDQAHASGTSGHNPDESGNAERQDADNVDEVRALDLDADIDPAPGDELFAELDRIRRMPELRRRLIYIIYRRKIASASNGWTWQDYSGDNPHYEHGHLSGHPDHDNNTAPWGVAREDDMDATQAAQLNEMHELLTRWRAGMPTMADGKRTIEPVGWRIRDEVWQRRVDGLLVALAASVEGLDMDAVLRRLDEHAAAEATRDAELRALVEAGQSGELTAEQVLTKLRDLLPAGETPA